MRKWLSIIFIIILSGSLLAKMTPQPKVIIRSDSPNFKDAIVISIDLCPSSKRYDKKLFKALEEIGRKRGKPVPVAIAVSGKWIINHVDELEEIRKMYLDITWVNHSYSHPVENDFCDNPNVDFISEVQKNIDLFRKYQLKVSEFFRFPGLIHNKQRLAELARMGYIALDADAWLGKGQEIHGGSIVLIHGNGNESKMAMDKFLNYLKTHEKEIFDNKLRLVSIEAFIK